jgi:hypothetical protein
MVARFNQSTNRFVANPYLATITLILSLIAASAVAQHAPYTLTGVFNLDLPDVTAQGKQALKEALNNAGSGQDPTGCRPPALRTKMVIVMGFPGDPAFREPLGKLRVDETNAYLKTIGSSSTADVTSLVDPAFPSDGTVRVSYDDNDTDPPALEVHSNPPKGSKVAAGQQIALTIRASEHFEDGHKSLPSGVQLTQLLDDNGLVKAWEYGKPPVPCEVRTEQWTYTVPNDPAPVVHLLVESEDGVGNHATKTADFPTGDWYGTIKAQGLSNSWKDSVSMDFTFSVDSDGAVAGKGHAKMTNSAKQQEGLGSGGCYTTYTWTPAEKDIAIHGRRDGDAFALQLETPPSAGITYSHCPLMNPHPDVTLPQRYPFFWPMSMVPNFRSPRVAATDGATNSLNGEYSRASAETIHVVGTIEIHQSKQSGN